MSEPCIRLRHVSRFYSGSVKALDDVSLEVQPREIFTIVGPSGCGKSTLLRILAGLDHPTHGEIEIRGRVMNDVPAHQRNIAMVFQSYALYPHMTCFENLALNLRLKKVPEAEIATRVQETARLLEIGDHLHKKPRELSGGQRQRVAVARALIRRPEAFLFDEPLSNLDALLRERVRHDLKELFRKVEATVVYVTHDQVEAMTLADRVMVLDRGRVQQIGSPEDVYQRPRNQFVARFIGSPSMNLFDARVTGGVFQVGGVDVNAGVDWSGDAVIGARPEHVRLDPAGSGAAVRWAENLGSHYLVGIDVGGLLLTAIAAQRPERTEVGFGIDAGCLHVFEKSSGERVVRDRAGDPADL